jgi:hypothetical protein
MSRWLSVSSRYPDFALRFGRDAGEVSTGEIFDVTLTVTEDEARQLYRDLGKALGDRDQDRLRAQRYAKVKEKKAAKKAGRT